MNLRAGRPPDAVAVTLALGLVAVVLGYVGYRDADSSLDALDALYRAIGLLVLEYYGPAANPPWQLEAARFLAAVVLAYAILSVLVVIAREGADALRLRLMTTGHYVVVGLGARGATVVARLRSAGHSVAAIESDPAAPRTAGARSHGAIVVTGDARDPKVLDKVQVAKASHILVVAGDDSTNLEILAACENRFAEAPRIRTRAHVAIDDTYLWAQLHRRSLERENRSGRVEFISFPDRIAAKLVGSAREELAAPDVERILVWGQGPVALRTGVHAMRRMLLAGRAPELALGGPDEEALRTSLSSVDPWIEAVAGPVALGSSDEEFDVGFVAGLREAEALAAAARLSDSAVAGRLVVQVPHGVSERSLAGTGYDLSRIRLVAAEHEAFDPSLFTESALDVIARAKHEDYVTQELARGVHPAENPSILSWEDLPATLKASNLRFAESVGRKLTELEAQLLPLSSGRPHDQFVLTSAHLEELARAEHERWVHDLIDDGWRPTEGRKDPERKLHPLLVPWEELAAEQREKDRDAIRALPEMLARIGYEIGAPSLALSRTG